MKRKKPEPTIPFNRAQPFFNPASEPNLELLNVAIGISLKRLKNVKEEFQRVFALIGWLCARQYQRKRDGYSKQSSRIC
jgi:hypothetical protein